MPDPTLERLAELLRGGAAPEVVEPVLLLAEKERGLAPDHVPVPAEADLLADALEALEAAARRLEEGQAGRKEATRRMGVASRREVLAEGALRQSQGEIGALLQSLHARSEAERIRYTAARVRARGTATITAVGKALGKAAAALEGGGSLASPVAAGIRRLSEAPTNPALWNAAVAAAASGLEELRTRHLLARARAVLGEA